MNIQGNTSLHCGLWILIKIIALLDNKSFFFYSIAALETYNNICELLIKNYADINIINKEGYSPLHCGEYFFNT